jgi:hypothetical protein
MANKTISKLVTEKQLEEMHNLLDLGYGQLSSYQKKLLDSLLDTVTTAISNNGCINFKLTNHIKINNIYYLDRVN